jgi:hypothetical protein
VGSPQPPDRAAALGTAQTLANALDGMAKRLAEVNASSEERDAALKKYGRRNRLAVGVDILLTVVIALLAIQNSATADRVSSANAKAVAATASATALHAAQVSGCQAGNAERAGELRLWTYLFHASTPGSKAQQEAVARFMVLVGETFAPRNCVKAYTLTPQKGVTGGSR